MSLSFTWERIECGLRLRDNVGGIWMANDTEVALVTEIERLRGALLNAQDEICVSLCARRSLDDPHVYVCKEISKELREEAR